MLTLSRKRLLAIVALSVLLVVSCGLFLLAGAADEPVNLLTNPGFEADGAPNKFPTAWSPWGMSDGCYTVQGNAHGGDYYCVQTKSARLQVYCYQKLSGLSNGKYTMRAWVKYSGGMESCVLGAKDADWKKEKTPPVTDTWTEFTITDISITGGKVSVGFWSDSIAKDKYFCFDDVEFFKQP